MVDGLQRVYVKTRQVRGKSFPSHFGIGYKQYTRLLASDVDRVQNVLDKARGLAEETGHEMDAWEPKVEITQMNEFANRLMQEKVIDTPYLYYGSPAKLVTGFTTNPCYLTPDEEKARALAGPEGYVYRYRTKEAQVVMLELPSTSTKEGGELVYLDSFLEEEWEAARVERLTPLLETDNLAHLLMMYTPVHGVFYRKQRLFHMFPPFDSLDVVSEEHDDIEVVLTEENLKGRRDDEDVLELIPHAVALHVPQVRMLSPTAGVQARSLALQQMFNMYSPDIVLDVDKFAVIVQQLLNDGVDGTGLALYYKSARWDGNEKTVAALRRLPVSLFYEANFKIADYDIASESE
jgi:hypothetical protein